MKPNYTYKVLLIIYCDAETRIVKEVYRTTSNKKAKMYMAMYGKFIFEQGEIEVLGKLYSKSDWFLRIGRIRNTEDDLPF